MYTYKRKALEPGIRPIFCIGDQAVKYVSQWLHLGHIVSDGCDDKVDIVNRRDILCGQINNVLCLHIVIVYTAVFCGI